jgi:hypothetical protein
MARGAGWGSLPFGTSPRRVLRVGTGRGKHPRAECPLYERTELRPRWKLRHRVQVALDRQDGTDPGTDREPDRGPARRNGLDLAPRHRCPICRDDAELWCGQHEHRREQERDVLCDRSGGQRCEHLEVLRGALPLGRVPPTDQRSRVPHDEREPVPLGSTVQVMFKLKRSNSPAVQASVAPTSSQERQPGRL